MQTTEYAASGKLIHCDEHWYALYTRHQHERSVAAHLESRGFSTLCPTYMEIRQWRDRKKEITLPVFPCYVFIQGGIERQISLLSTPGVHSIVCTGKIPAPIGDDEIAAIRRAMDHSIALEPAPFIREGEFVRVICGPLRGVEGVVQRRKDAMRLIISVEILGRSASVEIQSHEIEPCERNPLTSGIFRRPQDSASVHTPFLRRADQLPRN
jgi:transcription antitermination factor NusG